jgi:hypothetical protein
MARRKLEMTDAIRLLVGGIGALTLVVDAVRPNPTGGD